MQDFFSQHPGAVMCAAVAVNLIGIALLLPRPKRRPSCPRCGWMEYDERSGWCGWCRDVTNAAAIVGRVPAGGGTK